MDLADEQRLREQIMRSLAHATGFSPTGPLSRAELSAFDVDGQTWRLIDHSRGIRNPRSLAATLSLVSSPDGPYADEPVTGGLFRYDYRAGSDAGDNTKLRRAYELQRPLIPLQKLSPGNYLPNFPVYIVADDPANRQVYIALDEGLRFLADPMHLSEQEQRYAQRIARQRLHQPAFRARVLQAYDVRCCVCSLRHGNLLDAAHITPDSTVGSSTSVRNGLSMCKIHHAAYDGQMLGISPDYEVRIAERLLDEIDGPMLRHGLQDMDGRKLTLPSRPSEHPNRERLADRYNQFREAA